MPVAGKSTLAADAVRDPEITLQVNEKCVMIFLSLYIKITMMLYMQQYS